MKIHSSSTHRSGFTLMELMVAMAITTIIVTVLVSITAIATDTWNRSRSELRAARQAKALVDVMARDYESLVSRRGNANEWLSAISSASTVGNGKAESANSSDILFFSGAMDRYDGDIGIQGKDSGGDVSGVAYRLFFKDPIDSNGTAYETFVFHRLLVNPDVAFKDLLGKEDLTAAFNTVPAYAGMDKGDNFICENIYQFTVTFHVETNHMTGATSSLVTVPVTVGKSAGGAVTRSFKLKGTGIDTSAVPSGVTADELKAGRISAVEVSLTVLSDHGMNQLRSRNFPSDIEKAKFLAKNSYNYSKRIQVPSM
jgi:prepilin-type N-terminal cleavage/methylation domain-containing protein